MIIGFKKVGLGSQCLPTCDISESIFAIVFQHLLPANQDSRRILRLDLLGGEAGEATTWMRKERAWRGVCLAPPPPKKKVHQPTLLLEVTLVAEHQCFQGKQMQAHTQLHMSFPQMTYMPKDVAGEAAANYRRRDGCWGGGVE